MMNTQIFTYTQILLLTFIFACSHSHISEEDQAILDEAATIHAEAYEIQGQVAETMKQASELSEQLTTTFVSVDNQDSTFILKQGQAQEIIGALNTLQTDLKAWEDNAVAVPGEDEHDHSGHDHSGHDHDHSHEKTVEVTAQEMLDIQKEMKSQITEIQQKTQKTITEAQDLLAQANIEESAN